MSKKILSIFFCFFFCFCSNNTEKKAFFLVEKPKQHPVFSPLPIPYIVTKENIKNELKLFLKNNKNNIDFYKRLEIFFEKKMIEDIIPYWYETKWDFNGYTAIPQNGTIACGYFVSTTLRDVGVKLNRVKIAQALPTDEAMMLAEGHHSIIIYNQTFFKNYALQTMHQQLEDGLYFMAFPQTHVGFLWKNKGNLFLIHSGKTAGKTVIEHLENLPFLHKFQYFLILPLSANHLFLKKWIM